MRQDELGLTSVSAANNTPLTTEVLRPDSVTQKERNTDGRTECDPPSQNSHPIKRKKELLLQAQSHPAPFEVESSLLWPQGWDGARSS